MTKSAFVAEQLVRQLEVLLETARAAAVGLETDRTVRPLGRAPSAPEGPEQAPTPPVVPGTTEGADNPPLQGEEEDATVRAEGDDRTLLQDRSAHTEGTALPGGTCANSERLSVFAIESQLRNGRQRYVVQLQGPEAIYSGTAVTHDFAEPRARVAARAALAAMAEWAGERWQFGLGDLVHVSLNHGLAALVTIALRPVEPGPAPARPTAMAAADAIDNTSAEAGQSPDTQPGLSETVPSEAVESGCPAIGPSAHDPAGALPASGPAVALTMTPRRPTSAEGQLLGSAWQWDDPADAAVRAVLDAFADFHHNE